MNLVIFGQAYNTFMMGLFRTVQRKLDFIGIEHPSKASHFFIKVKILLIISLMVGMMFSSLVFILYREKTFSEIAEAFFLLMTAILATTVYTIFVRHRDIFYKLIDDAREIIRKRKIFSILHRWIDDWMEHEFTRNYSYADVMKEIVVFRCKKSGVEGNVREIN